MKRLALLVAVVGLVGGALTTAHAATKTRSLTIMLAVSLTSSCLECDAGPRTVEKPGSGDVTWNVTSITSGARFTPVPDLASGVRGAP